MENQEIEPVKIVEKSKDIDNVEINDGDIIFYTDTKNRVNNEKGYVRYNSLANVYEVVRLDLQTGTQLGLATNMKK